MSTKPVCGCKIVQGHGKSPRIKYCPLHEQGPTLWHFLDTIQPFLEVVLANPAVAGRHKELFRVGIQMIGQVGRDQERLCGVRPKVVCDMLMQEKP